VVELVHMVIQVAQAVRVVEQVTAHRLVVLLLLTKVSLVVTHLAQERLTTPVAVVVVLDKLAQA
jgi:hypothetical protein